MNYFKLSFSICFFSILASCGGSHSTGPSRPLPNPNHPAQDLDSKIENLPEIQELRGLKSSERKLFEYELYKLNDGTKGLAIVGSELVLGEENLKLLNLIEGADIKELLIHVDELRVTAPIRLPSAKIELVGEKLTFENEGSFDVSGADGEQLGSDGADAGEIILEYEEIKDLSFESRKRLFLSGGRGAKARPGQNGSNGKSVGSIGGDVVFRVTQRQKCIRNHLGAGRGFKEMDCHYEVTREGGQECPQNGTNAISASAPGRGGRRGSLLGKNTFTSAVIAMTQAFDGENGATSASYSGGIGGSPRRAVFEFVDIKSNGARSSRREACATTVDGSSATAVGVDSSLRDQLQWGERKEELSSFAVLLKIEHQTQYVHEVLYSGEYKFALRLVDQLLKEVSGLSVHAEELIFKREILAQKLAILKVMVTFRQRGNISQPLVEESGVAQMMEVYLSLNNPNAQTQNWNFLSALSARDWVEEETIALTQRIGEGSRELQKIYSELLARLSSKSYGLWELEKLQGQERREEFAKRMAHTAQFRTWLENSLQRLTHLVAQTRSASETSHIWNLLQLLMKKVNGQYKGFILTYKGSDALNLSARRELYLNLLDGATLIGWQAIQRQGKLASNFLYQFDFALSSRLESMSVLEGTELERATQTLMGPLSELSSL